MTEAPRWKTHRIIGPTNKDKFLVNYWYSHVKIYKNVCIYGCDTYKWYGLNTQMCNINHIHLTYALRNVYVWLCFFVTIHDQQIMSWLFKRSKAQSVFMAKGICTKDKPQSEGILTSPPTLCQNKIYQHHDVFYALCFMLYVLCMMMMMMMMNVGYQWNICCFSLLLFLFVEFVVAEFIITISFHQHSSNLQIPETWSFGDYYQLLKHLLGRVTWLTKQKFIK